MSTLRILVGATEGDKHWAIEFRAPAFPEFRASHDVPTYGDARSWLPRPAAGCGDGCDHRWCRGADPEVIEDALRDLRLRNGDGGVAVGRWLYDVLLAPVRRELDALAAGCGADVVELALSWPYPSPEDCRERRARWNAMSALPWELMRDERGPLAVSGADGRVAVAVTRVVAGTRWQLTALPAPPRVLFVLGAAMTDDSVRAGAEVLGLLRVVEADGLRVNHRVLDQASPERLRRAVAAFRPNIVHLICHGGTNAEGRGYLRLTSEDVDSRRVPAADAAATRYDDWTGDKLLEQLKTDDWQPPVVVLSACETAGNLPNGRRNIALGGPQLAAPLAVELIRGGIPVVVAMAGTIADRACRVFTRHFGHALATGKSLVEATARARRMAFAELPAADTADWALPALFLSGDVDPADVKAGVDPAAEPIKRWSDTLRLNPLPLFCARDRILAAFWSMLPGSAGANGWQVTPDRPGSLVLSTPHDHVGVGKTRTLKEIARQALTNGWLPVLVPSTPDNSPRDVPGFVRVLAEAFDFLVDEEIVPEADPRELRWLATALTTGPTDRARHQAVADELDRGEWPALREALCRDAETVLTAAREADPGLLRADARVIVLVDSLGQTSVPLLSTLFGENGVGPHGLGKKRQPVPLVAVVLGTGDDIRQQIVDRTGSGARWVEVHRLGPFAQVGDEDLLAYESVLLYPFRGMAGSIARTSWMFNRDLDADEWQRGTGYLRRSFLGRPGRFNDENRFEMILDAAQTWRLLVPADDRQAVR